MELNAIISIVNKNNNTCCESADLAGYKLLAAMLELALVFQPVEESMMLFESNQSFPYEVVIIIVVIIVVIVNFC